MPRQCYREVQLSYKAIHESNLHSSSSPPTAAGDYIRQLLGAPAKGTGLQQRYCTYIQYKLASAAFLQRHYILVFRLKSINFYEKQLNKPNYKQNHTSFSWAVKRLILSSKNMLLGLRPRSTAAFVVPCCPSNGGRSKRSSMPQSSPMPRA